MLDAHGIADQVHLDLGAVRDWDYYTGPTFEVFSEASGFALGSGGRYDTLLACFGAALPATGFVLHIDRCHDSIERRDGVAAAPSVLRVSWDDDSHAIGVDASRRLRARGVACTCDLTSGGDGALRVSATGARWSYGEGETQGSVDAAVEALAGTRR